MSGHSHWKQIKSKKGATDQKRGELFSKLLKVVAVHARREPNPQFNPSLKAAIERARQFNVPQNNIERAVKRASADEVNLEEVIMEAYGPGGIALIIEAITDNKNRTIQEVKTLLKKLNGRWAEPGSVRWVFNRSKNDQSGWQPKFKQEASEENKDKTEKLIQTLEDQNDVQKVYHNS
ncbi:MAG: YebC/PmpR family DNA-binding transcriptional regulator [Patescibacteria group bacterium]|nr:YebC/PmpR family DNA-binding transcriptional regulator [Patescibacteria group bacterium]